MISLDTARKLKTVGLNWTPKLHDFFVIPDRDMDEIIFVISDVQVTIDVLFGKQVVSFQGASEWALDSLIKEEAVWFPREDQLRELLEAELLKKGRAAIQLSTGEDGYRISFEHEGRMLIFSATEASEAYARGLYYLLQNQSTGESNGIC